MRIRDLNPLPPLREAFRARDASAKAKADLLCDEEGGALVEYVVALSFATMTAVFAMYAVGEPLLDHFFFAYSLAVQPM